MYPHMCVLCMHRNAGKDSEYDRIIGIGGIGNGMTHTRCKERQYVYNVQCTYAWKFSCSMLFHHLHFYIRRVEYTRFLHICIQHPHTHKHSYILFFLACLYPNDIIVYVVLPLVLTFQFRFRFQQKQTYNRFYLTRSLLYVHFYIVWCVI